MHMTEQEYQEILNGDIRLFHRYFEYQYPKMFQFCLSFFHDEGLAKDIVQDTFVTLWEKLSDIREAKALPAYSFRILRNRCLREVRMRAILNRFEHIDELNLNEAELSHYDENADILGMLFSQELDQAYQRAVKRLPDRCRQVFLLSREQNMRCSDIAQVLGLSQRTVENEVYRGLKLLKGLLKEFTPIFIIAMIPHLFVL